MNWQNVTVKLADLQPWEHNPRTMTKRQAQRLLKSWQDLGQFQTIAIGPQGQVYDGHQRLSALLAAHGVAFTVDARQAERELSEDERRYLTTQANLPVGVWNWDALAGWDAAQLQAWGFDDEALRAWNSDAANLATMLNVSDAEAQQAGIDVITEQYSILIECESEITQADLLERFSAEGLKCRALIS
jgi:hypothetical protein